MLEFTKLILGDIHKIKPFFSYSKNMICDNTVGGAFMWRDYFETEYAICNDTIIFKAKINYHNDVTAFSLPFGEDFHGSIGKIVEYCHHYKHQIVFYNASVESLRGLSEILGKNQFCKYEDWSDYLYFADDLITLKGRKYHGQRNHINYFKRNYPNYSFEEINKDNITEVIEFFQKLHSNFNKSTDILSEEYVKTVEVLENFDSYCLLGGLLKANDSIIAFSLGEILSNTLFVHIEKADVYYRGAYQVINNDFVKHFANDNIKFINRAEDNGDEGLRTAKLSYHPCKMLDKYIVFFPMD